MSDYNSYRNVPNSLVQNTLEVIEFYRKRNKLFTLKELTDSLGEHVGYKSISEQLVYDNFIKSERGTGKYRFYKPHNAFSFEEIKRLIQSKKERNRMANQKRSAKDVHNDKEYLKTKEDVSDSSEIRDNLCFALKELSSMKTFSEEEMNQVFYSHNIDANIGCILIDEQFIVTKDGKYNWVQKVDVSRDMSMRMMARFKEVFDVPLGVHKVNDKNLKKINDRLRSEHAELVGQINLMRESTKNDMQTIKSMHEANQKLTDRILRDKDPFKHIEKADDIKVDTDIADVDIEKIAEGFEGDLPKKVMTMPESDLEKSENEKTKKFPKGGVVDKKPKRKHFKLKLFGMNIYEKTIAE